MSKEELLCFCESIACTTNDEEGVSMWLCEDEVELILMILKDKGIEFKLIDMLENGEVSSEDYEDGADRYRIDINY